MAPFSNIERNADSKSMKEYDDVATNVSVNFPIQLYEQRARNFTVTTNGVRPPSLPSLPQPLTNSSLPTALRRRLRRHRRRHHQHRPLRLRPPTWHRLRLLERPRRWPHRPTRHLLPDRHLRRQLPAKRRIHPHSLRRPHQLHQLHQLPHAALPRDPGLQLRCRGPRGAVLLL